MTRSINKRGEHPTLRKKCKCYLCKRRERLSKRAKYCLPCLGKIMQDNIRQLKAKEGAYYDKWKSNLMRSLTANA